MAVCLNSPEEVGFSSDRLERISPLMRRYVDERKVAGIVTYIARFGRTVHFETFGYQDLELRVPMQRDTIFRIYSMTKPITSVALMMLYERGLFQLSDPVSKYVPEFKGVKVWGRGGRLEEPRREMTIHHLLTHTAGLRYGGYEETQSALDRLYDEAGLWSPEITNEEMVRRLARLPLAFHPGEQWHYSVATDVVGYLVEILSDRPLAQFFDEEIFQPLGMVDTHFVLPREKAGRFATLYGMSDENSLALIDETVGGDYFNTRLHSGGAGLVSTAADYSRFAQMMLKGGQLDGVRLLGRKTVEFMTRNHLPPDLLPLRMGDEEMPGLGFGLGVSVMLYPARAGIMGSEGLYAWGGWASTHFWVDPREGVVGILLLQYIPSGTYPISNEFRTLVYQALTD
jgi:CubicO group peptidase (beta-lactamase class C family)